jgi:lipoprotein-anchoring transpeptidase ErfK/SrfK
MARLKKVAIIVPAFLLAVWGLSHIGISHEWVDAPPSPDSLALEARSKLMNSVQDCVGEAVPKPDATRKNRQSAKGKYIVIDTHTNHLYVRTRDSVLFSALCSTGTGAELVDTGTGRFWQFDTPKGVFKIDSRLTNPWWRKPDWAFIEEGKAPPKSNAERMDSEVLGDYAIGFGDGFFIHGTIYERLIGVSVTHGCVRLASKDIQRVYDMAPIGTTVIIF